MPNTDKAAAARPETDLADAYAFDHLGGSASAGEQFRSYLSSLLGMGRWKLAKLALLVVVGSISESFGILLLVPMLDLAFAQSAGSGATQGFASDLARPCLAAMSPDLRSAALLLAFVALLLVRAIVGWQRDLRLLALSNELVEHWRGRLARSIVAASWRRLQEIHFSRLEFALLNDVGRLSIGSDRLLRGGVALVQFAFLSTLAFQLSPPLIAVTFGVILVTTPVLIPAIRAAHRFGAETSRQGSKRHAILSDFMQGMKLAKAHDAEHRHSDAFLALTHDMNDRSLRYTDLQLRAQNAFQVAGGFAVACIAAFGLTRTDLAPATLMAFIVVCGRLVQPVQQLVGAVQGIISFLPAVGGLLALEAHLAEGAGPIGADRPGRSQAPDSGPAALAIESIAYTPPGRDEPVLKACNATLEAGELVLLLGPSGSGKTTLVDILLGLVAPDEGAISLDGARLSGKQAAVTLRSGTAYVPQDPFLFDTSLRENLAWAAPGVTEAEIWRALELAEAASFVRRLPDGLDSRPGHRGGSISGGERQRICLARALLRKPRLLILDEATSALDPGVEGKLVETLARLRGTTTILMIAHRLPQGLVADKTLRLSDGKLA